MHTSNMVDGMVKCMSLFVDDKKKNMRIVKYCDNLDDVQMELM